MRISDWSSDVCSSDLTDKQGKIEGSNETGTALDQRWQQFEHIGPAHQGGTEITDEIGRRALENRQHVITLEQGIVRREPAIVDARRQAEVAGVTQQPKGKYHADRKSKRMNSSH